MKILIAVDGSIYTDHALEFLASREGFLASSPEIEMLSVVPQIPAGALRFIERETLEGYYKDCSEKIFKPIRKFLKGKDLPVEEVYVVGDPSEGIADEVDRTKPDLVVMGSRGRSSLKGLFLGSVTRGVLARTKVPMLIVRSDLRDLRIVSPDFSSMVVLEEREDFELVLIGGQVRHGYHFSCGDMATSQLNLFHADKCFISPGAIDLKEGLTTPSVRTSYLKAKLMDIAHETILISDSTKYGTVCFNRFASLDEVSHIVVDNELDPEVLVQLESTGRDVLLA